MTSPVTPELLGRLLDEHGGALVMYAAQWTDTPDDCVQEALVELVKQPALPARPVAWLFRVVRNRAISHARSAGRRRKYETAVASQTNTWFEPSPGSSLDAASATEALQELSPQHREVIVARIWGGLSFEQIAELVGSSVSTAHRRYGEGLTHLRERLGWTWLVKDSTRTI